MKKNILLLVSMISLSSLAMQSLTPMEMLNMTAESFTARLKELNELKSDSKMVDGVGAIVFYKIGEDYFQVSGFRACELMLGNGGKIAPEVKLIDQLRAEFDEETFSKLPLAGNPLHNYYIDAKSWGTFATFIFVDDNSFKTKEELEQVVLTMNPSADFYNSIFSYVIGAVRGWKNFTKEEHTQQRTKLAQKYSELKTEGKLLVDILDEAFFERLNKLSYEGKIENWWETAHNKLITDYKVGEYSERPSYSVYSLADLRSYQTEFFNNSAAKKLLAEIDI